MMRLQTQTSNMKKILKEVTIWGGIKRGVALLLLLLCNFNLFAQFYNGSQISFGKNRVQFQKFNWTYYRSTQYDVYFYPNSKALAEYTFAIAPQYIREIEKRLNYSSSKKIQFIVYNTQGDFRESNFAFDNEDFYNQGGITNVYGTKIYLYFNGDHNHFDRMIKEGIANTFAHLLIEGQNLGANISSEYLIDVPNWFYSGLAAYIAGGWSSERDAYIKSGILSGKFENFDNLSLVESSYAGYSFWRFIVERFGEAVIPNILYSTRATRSVEKGFAYVIGTPFDDIMEEWYRSCYVAYKNDIRRDKPEDDGVLKHPKSSRNYSNITLSADGESFAYVTNESGQLRVWFKDANAQRPRTIFQKYAKTEDNPDLSFPILHFHPNGRALGFTLESKGRCYFYLYDCDEKKMEKPLLVDVEKVTAWNFDKKGRNMVFSGYQGGQSDIFLYNFRSRTFQNLTQDFYDDFDPQYMNDKGDVIFASNRPSDSLFPNAKFYNCRNREYSDLFVYNYEKKNPQLLQVTFTPHANESDVQIISSNKVIYLSDENGITNRFEAVFDSAITKIDTIIHYAYFAKNKPLTNNAYSIADQDYCAATRNVAEILLRKGVKRIYIHPLEQDLNTDTLISSTYKAEYQKYQHVMDSIKAEKNVGNLNPKNVRKGFRQAYKGDIVSHKKTSDTLRKNKIPAQIFTEGFEYKQITHRNYEVQYSINRLVTQADYGFLNTAYQQFAGGTSPIYLNTGMNALFMVGINDLFENYRITGGFRLSFDMSGKEFMLSYEDLSKRVDHQIVVYRQSLKKSVDYYMFKQQSNSFFYIAKIPFNKFHALRFTLTGRLENLIVSALDDVSLKAPNQYSLWTGAKMEYVFDSSKELATNLWHGSKLKIFAEYNQKIAKQHDNLIVLGFDFRKSVHLFRNMTWATRLAASTSFGVSRLVYFMGGVDNWIAPKFNSTIWVDQTKNYQYQTLATSMRGFSQNTRNGTSFALLSTELRMPVVQLVTGKKISRPFFNSIQLIAFADLGTAWTGLTPYSEENCLYTRYIDSGNIHAVVKRQVDPWIIGVGAGLRASLLGYFLRFDYAWGIENFQVADKKGMFLFSIGTDF